MNTRSTLLGIFSVCLIAGSAFGQERQQVETPPVKVEEVKVVKKEIRKEIQMEDNDGEKTLTIITDDGGVVTKEVFVGEAAEAKLAELSPQMEDVSIEQERVEERIEVEVDDEGNLQSVTIKKSRNGEETIEVLEGEAAQKKLEEVNAHMETKVKVPVKQQKRVKRTSAKAAEEEDN